ncbi:MAG TPA: ankyrin repeat domain-containing protein [Gemmatimonadaceae bacterium]
MTAPHEEQTDLDRFRHAVESRDARALRQVLEQSAEARAAINEPLFGFDSPALVAVAGSGDLDLVETLLRHGADPNRRSDWWAGGFHPLHATSGAVADLLLSAGAVADACAAARIDRPDLLERILTEDPSRVHERGGDGQTPLHFARSRRVVDMLLAAGADLDARDVDHRATAAEWMSGSPGGPDDRTDLARYLVEQGATADIFLSAALGLTERAEEILRQDPSALALRTSQGDYGEQPPSSFHIYQWTLGPNLSPMQVAAERGHEDTARALELHASPAERLLLACLLGRRDEALAIVSQHPDVVSEMSETQRRGLADAAWAGNASAVGLMLELGFDPAFPGPMGANALHCASWEGSIECVRAILAHASGRALVDSREPTYGGTPLSWCCHGSRHCGNPAADHGAVARLLIAAGSRVDPEMLQWDCAGGVHSALAEAVKSR